MYYCFRSLRMPEQLVWLYARHTDRSRLRDGRLTLPLDAIYTPAVRSSLAATLAVDHRFVQNGPAATSLRWHSLFDRIGNRIIGLALVRDLGCFDDMKVLSSSQRCLADYWSHTKYGCRSFLFHVHVLAACLFVEPQVIRYRNASAAPASLFFRMTSWSFDRLVADATSNGSSPLELVQLWCQRFELDPVALLGPPASGQRFDVAACLPAAHGHLLAVRHWKKWCFPVAVKPHARAAFGLHFVSQLFYGHQLPKFDDQKDADVATRDEFEFSAPTVQAIADQLRCQYEQAPSEELAGLIRFVQNRRDAMIRAAALQSQLAFEMDILVQTLLAGGYLRDMANLAEALTFGLYAVVKDPALLQHLLESLHGRVLPSPTTLRRHRLTLHIGWCRYEAEVFDAFLKSPNGCVRWGTLDASPQGGIDWLLHGGRIIRSNELVGAMVDANGVCNGTLSDGTPADANALKPVLQRLSDLLQLHHGAPCGIGSGHASLQRKVHGILHSMRLSSKSWSQACLMLRSTATWTGDLGTESLLWTFKADARDVFGRWIAASDLSDNPQSSEGLDTGAAAAIEHFDIVEEGGVDAAASFSILPEGDAVFDPAEAPEWGIDNGGDLYNLDLEPSIFIPGVLHIISNITKDLAAPLEYWNTWLEQLRHVCRLLSRKASKQRVIEACFSEPPQSLRAGEIHKFKAGVYDGRWGSVTHAASSILLVEETLKYGWDKDRYTRGRPADDGRNDEHSLKVDLADAAIRNGLFWGYTRMVDILAESLSGVAEWSEGCMCHPRPARLQGVSRHKRTRANEANIGVPVCPLSTMRAPAMAANEHIQFLDQLMNVANTDLLFDPRVAGLSQVDRGIVLKDFRSARLHLNFSFAVKLRLWRQLPWICFGIGHPNEAIARSCGRRALLLFAATSEEPDHHPISLLLCSPGTRGFAELTLFAEGACRLSELPFLGFQAARLRFAPVSERWVESLHSLTKRHLALAPHASAIHVAFHGVQQPLRLEAKRTPSFIKELARFCTAARTPTRCLQECGLWMHPATRRLRAKYSLNELNRSQSGQLAAILYHVDGFSLHAQWPLHDESDAGGPGPGPGGGGGPPPPLDPPPLPPPSDPQPQPAVSSNGRSPGGSDASRGRTGGNASSNGSGNAHNQSGTAASSGGGQASGSGTAHNDSGAAGSSGDGRDGGPGGQPPRKGGFGPSATASDAAGEGSSILHDELWCKAATDFLKKLAVERREANLPPLYFSLGPKLSKVASSFLVSISDITSPGDDQNPLQSNEFFFVPEPLGGAQYHPSADGGNFGDADVRRIASHLARNVIFSRSSRQTRDKRSCRGMLPK